MKTKILLLAAIIAFFTISVAGTKSGKDDQNKSIDNNAKEAKVSKGLAMEDKNQFK